MLLDDEVIISGIEKTMGSLIDLINEGRVQKGIAELPALKDLTFNDLSIPIIAAASRKREGQKHQRVLFGGEDKFWPSMLATSDPKDIGGVKIKGIDENVLTKVVIEGEEFNDGIDSDYQNSKKYSAPSDNALLLSPNDLITFCSIPVFCAENDYRLAELLENVDIRSEFPESKELPFDYLPPLNKTGNLIKHPLVSLRFLDKFYKGELDQSLLSAGTRWDKGTHALNTAIAFHGLENKGRVKAEFLRAAEELVLSRSQVKRSLKELDEISSL